MSAHLTIVELLENTKTATSIARMPIGANVGRPRRAGAIGAARGSDVARRGVGTASGR